MAYSVNQHTGSQNTEDLYLSGVEELLIGDYIAKARLLPPVYEGDIIGVLDAGAYGYSMNSQYNHRQRPAEVLITESGEVKQIRRRDTYEDMLVNML